MKSTSVHSSGFRCLQRTLHAVALLAVLGLMAVPAAPVHQAHAQDGAVAALGRPNVQDYGRPGYPRMTVTVWGDAQSGVWTVEEGTDLLEFLSVSSQTRLNERLNTRTFVLIQVYREGQRGKKPMFEERLDDMLARNTPYPDLREGDMVVVRTQQRRRFTWRDITQVTGTIIGLLNTYLILDRLNN